MNRYGSSLEAWYRHYHARRRAVICPTDGAKGATHHRVHHCSLVARVIVTTSDVGSLLARPTAQRVQLIIEYTVEA